MVTPGMRPALNNRCLLVKAEEPWHSGLSMARTADPSCHPKGRCPCRMLRSLAATEASTENLNMQREARLAQYRRTFTALHGLEFGDHILEHLVLSGIPDVERSVDQYRHRMVLGPD